MKRFLFILVSLLGLTGCHAFPEVAHQPQFHNPFPQLEKVAILPFFNLSDDPTVDSNAVALAYYQELQQIPGFEVMPPGVVLRYLEYHDITISGTTDFQQLARDLGVDVIIRGAVTDFTAYYPPRMGITADWFAANPSYHPIPPGYGLPWGTAREEYIPSTLVHEAEFALAREQLKTQTPPMPELSDGRPRAVKLAQAEELAAPTQPESILPGPKLPEDWPDPRGFIPPAPAPQRPQPWPQTHPIIAHTRLYHGSDGQFTERLAEYFYFRDDARFGGWQGYLQRSDDFIGFCCYMHITETLAARGGAGETRVVWRWPFGRYEQ